MNLAETIYQKSLDLPEDKAIDVIDFLKNRSRPAATVKQTQSLHQMSFQNRSPYEVQRNTG